MLKYEFVQGGEFDDPQYNVIFYNEIDEYEVGYIYFSKGYWNYANYFKYGLPAQLPAHLMIEIGNKMEELDRSVESQLFLGRF